MGLYDTVWFTCPKCDNEELSVQSKAGDSSLSDYQSDSVPVEIAADVSGDVVYCEDCKQSYKVISDNPKTHVQLYLVRA